jgi:hypothetical protein
MKFSNMTFSEKKAWAISKPARILSIGVWIFIAVFVLQVILALRAFH